ncbi:MAG: NADH-quinone oxidoreductase subunit C, partial [bacterium]
PENEDPFQVVFQLISVDHARLLRLKVKIKDGQEVPSVVGVWSSANWLEREVYDLFGISFSGHPDLRRILLPENWGSHPLRKDYPLEGRGERVYSKPTRKEIGE